MIHYHQIILETLLEKYINTLLLKYPNSPQAMLALANVYLKPNSSFYNFEKSAQAGREII